ncbi:hypothetical protein B0T26DRAFT_739017 [Lasiosphaeria miniovina]|uniref:Uncharacterized protein n=1 Tax=Lasiosphaeria miniovina TaxID=1954250 RepID=A0AA40B719_9PEZI|nr:uncharacterized protein B0T26DRAFT_739017 [Lasiosphaeria miniovina]KAK0728777.1 hypothetical protein B0T26DRAFT_739017 [Lasiosphaeria miniovina]
MPPPVRHLILPFDLRDDPSAMWDSKKRDMMSSIFPGTTGISSDRLFVRNGSIAEDRNGRDMEDWKPLFHIIKDHFEGLGVSITEVIYWGDFVYIVLKHRDTDFSKLPCQAANISCVYLFDDEMGRPPAPQARRLLDPTPGNPDDSQYDTLQPRLRDRVGNEFMTVASHGFSGEYGTQIGELIMEVSHTDVALNDDTPQPVWLKKLTLTKECQTGDMVYLDSPDTGCIEGMLMKSSFQAVPSDDGSPEQQWVFTAWYYLGQDSAINLPEEICGSAIWKKDGDVLGFFRYAPKEGFMMDWCAGIAAGELITRGFTLVNTGDRA